MPIPQPRYEGSSYHKRYPTASGTPRFGSRSDKTPCPDEISQNTAAEVLETAINDAIAAGDHSVLRDGDWPRYAWGRAEFTCKDGTQIALTWEARVNNRSVPTYKAYPITKRRHSQHMPLEVFEKLWQNR